jgi:choice-of-anchor B domain-containing protein
MKTKAFLLCLTLLCLAIAQPIHAQLNVGFNSQINYTDAVNDIWGYTDASGNEYALVGTQTGLAIVDVTDPNAIDSLHFVAGPNNTWRDVHTWSHYAYMVTESSSSGGLLIIDLAGLPSTITTYYTAMGFGYYSAHTLYIDDSTGIGYLFGAKSSGQGNATFFIDIAANPTNPTYLGKYSTAYVHDGYVRNDTMWTAEVYAGRFSVVNVSNKSNPVVMASQTTPYAFTHTVWLSDNSNYLFVTDEKNAAPVVAYDVSDILDIKELDRYRTKPISDSLIVAHNDYVRGDFLVSSYYTAGITIADISRPHNIIEVGNYDTSPLTGGGYNGCWGVYPYFNSGTILATDRQEGLFVLSPTYVHACWLEGTVSNALTNSPIANATVQIIGMEAGFDRSDFAGFYATGTAIAATYQVVASANGYYNDTLSVTLSNGVLNTQNIALVPLTYCSQTPTNLAFTVNNDTTATFTWDNMPNTQQYALQYRRTNSATWQTHYSTTPNATINTLSPCTDYEFRLQSLCNYGISSPYTLIDTFATLAPSAVWASTTLQACPNNSLDLNARVLGKSGGTWSGGSYVSSNGIFDPTGLSSGNYTVTYTVVANTCTVSESHDIAITPCYTAAHLKAILGGAYNPLSNLMNNSLVTNNLLPTTQSYNVAPWNYAGTETFGTLPSNAVDWVLVELHPAGNMEMISQQAAAILLQDGTLISPDGASGVQFLNVDAAQYYILLRHRNHLAVMSNSAVSLPNTASTPYDFTASGAAMGTNQTYAVNSNLYALRPGDTNANGVITVSDFNIYAEQIAQINLYSPADINLDRTITVADFNQYFPHSSFIGIPVVRY